MSGSTEGSGNWVLAIFFVIFVAACLAYPHQMLFLAQFLWDILLKNLRDLFDSIFKHTPAPNSQ